MELVKNNINEIITSDFVELVLNFEETQARLKVMESALNDEIKDYLLANNLDNIEIEKDGVKIKWTYIAPSKTKKCDYAKMKADGLYEKYVRESDKDKKDFVRRTVSYE